MAEKPFKEYEPIVWHGEFKPGVIFFGLSKKPFTAPFPFEHWPNKVSAESYPLYGDNWHAVSWSVLIEDWPKQAAWQTAVKATLESLVKGGAVVAWLGEEGSFIDPPALFTDPMAKQIFGYHTADGQCACVIDPDEPSRGISVEEVRHLRQTMNAYLGYNA